MFQKFKPINEFVLVELIEKEQKTAGGLFIPSQAQEKNQIAIVVHAGKSKQVKKGETIYYKKYMGSALDDKFTVLKEEEILGIL